MNFKRLKHPNLQKKQRCFSTSHRHIGVPSAVELLRLVY
jgi:hypothetical protein